MIPSCNTYRTIGLMSGTSLDGVDLVYAHFHLQDSRWNFQILHTRNVEYSPEWKKRLHEAVHLSGLELALLDMEYGHFLGNCIRQFIRDYHLEVDFAAVHGHTIFHQPQQRLTLQIGEPTSIAAEAHCKVIAHFRNKDVAMGGEGAPLVPVGDMLLFPEYDFCLNLGGFSNISFTARNGRRTAFDISPCNIPLNRLANLLGKEFDEDGKLARTGKRIESLCEELNRLDFYQTPPPKSLGMEWYMQNFEPLLQKYLHPSIEPSHISDLLCSCCEHIGFQIGQVCRKNLPSHSPARLLLSGGGAYHRFLVEKIREYSSCEVVSASPEIIDYKEALIFAFLGVLRWREECNCLSSVTGATQDNVGGGIYW